MSKLEVFFTCTFIILLAFYFCKVFNAWKDETIQEQSDKIAALNKQLVEKQGLIDNLRNPKREIKKDAISLKVGSYELSIEKEKSIKLSTNHYNALLNGTIKELRSDIGLDRINEEPNKWTLLGYDTNNSSYCASISYENAYKPFSLPFPFSEIISVQDESKLILNSQEFVIESAYLQRLSDVNEEEYITLTGLWFSYQNSQSGTEMDKRFFKNLVDKNIWFWVLNLKLKYVSDIDDIMKNLNL